jgi:glucuronokinase
MRLLRRRAYARAGLVGNPSDGYHGKTISFSVRDFWAEVVLYEWHDLEIVLSQDDRSRFRSIHELSRDVRSHGYYGGVRLVKATMKKFVEYCERTGYSLHRQNFAIRYSSNIPRQVGLAGSSAIIVATLRCLMDFYQVGIAPRVQPSLALSVEREELGIGAGLQDRVIQVYEGLVSMDFTEAGTAQIDGYECGTYEWMDPACLPSIYLAFGNDLSEPTEILHNDLRARYDRGEPRVVEAMKQFAALTDRAKAALEARDSAALGEIINANFDLRRSICSLHPGHVEMVECARRTGATAKYAGSGGAIVGTFSDDAIFAELTSRLNALGCRVVRPTVAVHLSAPSSEAT